MADLIPSPSNGPDQQPPKLNSTKGKEKRSSPKQERPEKSQTPDSQPIASEADCLRGLTQLPGLIAMGLVSTAKANSIRGAYATILGHHQKGKNARSDQQLDDQNVLEILRQNPEMLSMLEPLLTADQIAMVMRCGTDSEDGQA